MEQNLKNFLHQNEEKDARIRELEEQLKHIKKDKGGLKEFKECVKKVREKLNETAMDMYTHLQLFQ
jgi:predicted nuclease with TOPRIM domain